MGDDLYGYHGSSYQRMIWVFLEGVDTELIMMSGSVLLMLPRAGLSLPANEGWLIT